MSVYRNYMDQLSDDFLAVLWTEIEDWEVNGFLPEDAALRQVVRDAYDFGGYDWKKVDPELGMRGLDCDLAAKEVWREIAARASGWKL